MADLVHPRLIQSRKSYLLDVLAHNGGVARVARADTQGIPRIWFDSAGRIDYDFRVPIDTSPFGEVVFDIDHHDIEDRSVRWLYSRRDLIILSRTLSDLGVPHHAGLSGGSGCHIHVLLKNSNGGKPDRKAFAERIVALAREKYDPLGRLTSLSTDAVGYAKETQQFREWGSRKKRLKSLWRLPIHLIPSDQATAYRLCEGIIPAALPTPYVLDQGGLLQDACAALRDALGSGRCPPGGSRTPDCDPFPCDDCPLAWR